MGMASSALYRYFATRDELLTALIFDAYNDLGASVERAESRVARRQLRERWRAAARAIRRWARAHPHEYALLYGTPVPGYAAPTVTIAAATRVTTVLAAIMNDATKESRRTTRTAGDDPRGFLDVAALAPTMPDVAPERFVRALTAWTTLFGTVSFELFGHYVGSVRDAARYYDAVVEDLADYVGVTS